MKCLLPFAVPSKLIVAVATLSGKMYLLLNVSLFVNAETSMSVLILMILLSFHYLLSNVNGVITLGCVPQQLLLVFMIHFPELVLTIKILLNKLPVPFGINVLLFLLV